MANPARRVADNVPGPFFVDDTCIDCGACRWIAPVEFGHTSDRRQSCVVAQPAGEAARAAAHRALVSCPTGSIGTGDKRGLADVIRGFPYPLGGGVYHCGFHSRASFGAASYLVVRPGGNVLVDSPRYNEPLMDRIEALGGVRWMFLTHRDDVADHARIAQRFGCTRILHARDVRPGTRGVETKLTGRAPVAIADGVLAIPTPGHTEGSCCLLVGDDLFTGDHLAFSPVRGHLIAFVGACWHDWSVQRRSMRRLATYRFTRVLPGHGTPCALAADAMAAQLDRCIEWMEGVG